MSEYEKFLTELAEKLGITVEKLWGVMVNQAGISATFTTIALLCLVSITVRGYYLVKKKTTDPEEQGKYAEWTGDGAFLAWLLWGALAGISLIYALDSVNEIAAGFLNPEYWALMQLRG